MIVKIIQMVPLKDGYGSRQMQEATYSDIDKVDTTITAKSIDSPEYAVKDFIKKNKDDLTDSTKVVYLKEISLCKIKLDKEYKGPDDLPLPVCVRTLLIGPYDICYLMNDNGQTIETIRG